MHYYNERIWPVRYNGEIPLPEAKPEIGSLVQRNAGTYKVTRIDRNDLCFGIDVNYKAMNRVPEPTEIGGHLYFL
jgi:hypothetical protein